jgi:hypothetical protein
MGRDEAAAMSVEETGWHCQCPGTWDYNEIGGIQEQQQQQQQQQCEVQAGAIKCWPSMRDTVR